MEELLNNVWQFLSGYGLPGLVIFVLCLIIVLIVQKPERANELRTFVLLPLYRLFRIGSKQYIAARVSSKVTDFIDKQLGSQLPYLSDTKVRIKWVSTPADPVLSRDGTLILRLEETNNQTRNIMAATRAAIPIVVCPTIRHNIHNSLDTSIDMALLYKLSDKLGKHAHPVFQKYFLNPEIGNDQTAAIVLQKLRNIDRFGIFLFIFLEELNNLGAAIYSEGDTSDKTESIILFLDFLLEIATREFEELTPLDHVSQDIRVSILLLAKSSKAEIKGITPYLDRINKEFQFADSVYILTYNVAKKFLPRLLTALEDDKRLTRIKNIEVPSIDIHKTKSHITLTLFQRNYILPEIPFEEELRQSGISQGDIVSGIVSDVAPGIAVVRVNELNAIISSAECSWQKYNNCNDYLEIGKEYNFLVKRVDNLKSRLELSMQFPEYDPWCSKDFPKVGDSITVTIQSRHGSRYIAKYTDCIQVIIPQSEVSWTSTDFSTLDKIIGTSCTVMIYNMVYSHRTIFASIVRPKSDFWRNLRSQMPNGTKLRGKVSDVTHDGVKVLLPNELVGEIPRESMLKAGFEYANYEESVVKNQGLDVVVIKINVGTHQIQLDLARNYYK